VLHDAEGVQQSLVAVGRPAGLRLGAVPLHRHLARRRVGPVALLRQPHLALGELGAPAPRLLQARREVRLHLVQALELAPQSLHALAHGGHFHAAGGELRHQLRFLRLRGLDGAPEAGDGRLVGRLRLPGGRDALLESLQHGRGLAQLGGHLPRLQADGLEVSAHALVLPDRLLQVLLARHPGRLARVDFLLEERHPGPERRGLGPEPGRLVLRRADLGLQPTDLVLQLADLALPGQERALPRLFGIATAPAQAPGGAQHLARRGHVGGHGAVPPPERLGAVEMLDHRHPAQQVVEQARRDGADAAGNPAHAVVLGQRARGRQVLEGQEGGRAGGPLLEVGQRRARLLEALHDHPLEALAQHGLHRPLEVRGYVDQVGHGPHDALHRGRSVLGEQRTDAGAVALARALQLAERVQAGPPRGQGHARAGQPPLGGGQAALHVLQLGREPGPLARQRGQAGGGAVALDLEAGARVHQPRRLRLGPGQLPRQSLAAPAELGLAFAQLPRRAGQVGALGGDADLLQAQALQPVALPGEARPVLLHARLQGRGGGRALGHQPLGLGQRDPGRLALAHDAAQPLAGEPHLVLQAHGLLRGLADLHAQLLAPLQQPLELRLDLLERLPEVRQRVVALLDGPPLRGLRRRELRGARPQLVLAVAEPRQLRPQPLGLGHQGGVVGGVEAERQVAPLLLQGFVLLRLARLALQGAQLPAHLVHDILDAHQVLAGGVELALGLVALLLVPGDPGCLLDEHPALVGLRGEDVVELLLVHHRVRPRVGAGAGEQVQDVAQARGRAVEEVLALPRPVEAPRHRDLAPRDAEGAVVSEGQLHLGQAHGLARGRAVEDQVLHAVAAEGPGALLAQCPPHRVRQVGLAAAVRTDDSGNPRQDLHLGPLAERLEAVQHDRLETHGTF
jgi:hypothetical protein